MLDRNGMLPVLGLCVGVGLWVLGCNGSGKPDTATPRPSVETVVLKSDKPTEELMGDLGSDDPAASSLAVAVLAERAKSDAAAADGLAGLVCAQGGRAALDAADALAKSGASQTAPRLIDALRQAHSRAHARVALRGVATKETLPALTPLVGDDDPYVRETGIDLVAKLGGADAINALTAGLATEDYRTRRQIAAVLGDTRDKRVAPTLVKLLSDSSPHVTEEAVYALRRLSGKNFGFRAHDPPAERAKAVAAWGDWAAK